MVLPAPRRTGIPSSCRYQLTVRSFHQPSCVSSKIHQSIHIILESFSPGSVLSSSSGSPDGEISIRAMGDRPMGCKQRHLLASGFTQNVCRWDCWCFTEHHFGLELRHPSTSSVSPRSLVMFECILFEMSNCSVEKMSPTTLR